MRTFTNVDAALRWASLIAREPILQDPSTYSLAGRSRGTRQGGGDLTEFERHGQAAQIVEAVRAAVDGIELAYIVARYFAQLRDTVPALTEWLLPALGTGAFRRRAVDTLVANQFMPRWEPFMRRIPRDRRMHRVPLEKVRADMQIDKRALLGYQGIVRDRLRGLHTQAIARVEAEMILRGIVVVESIEV